MTINVLGLPNALLRNILLDIILRPLVFLIFDAVSNTFIEDVSPTPPAISFFRPAWVKLNRLQTGVGLFRLKTYK